PLNKKFRSHLKIPIPTNHLSMKHYFQILIAIFLIYGCSNTRHAATQNPQKVGEQTSTDTKALLTYQDDITVDFLHNHLAAFSADSMEGRETGTPALKKAARYLSRQYKKMGLKPAGANNSYLQPFELAADVSDSITYTVYKQTEKGLRQIS